MYLQKFMYKITLSGLRNILILFSFLDKFIKYKKLLSFSHSENSVLCSVLRFFMSDLSLFISIILNNKLNINNNIFKNAVLINIPLQQGLKQIIQHPDLKLLH
jgi:hypothetical protein